MFLTIKGAKNEHIHINCQKIFPLTSIKKVTELLVKFDPKTRGNSSMERKYSLFSSFISLSFFFQVVIFLLKGAELNQAKLQLTIEAGTGARMSLAIELSSSGVLASYVVV